MVATAIVGVTLFLKFFSATLFSLVSAFLLTISDKFLVTFVGITKSDVFCANTLNGAKLLSFISIW